MVCGVGVAGQWTEAGQESWAALRRERPGHFLGKHHCGLGGGCRGPGVCPLRGEERFPLGAVQCSHCVSGVMGLGDRPLLSDRTAASLSIQPAKLCPCPSLAAWQEFAEVTRLRFPLSEVWCKRSVTCHFVIVQPSLKQPDSTLPF